MGRVGEICYDAGMKEPLLVLADETNPYTYYIEMLPLRPSPPSPIVFGKLTHDVLYIRVKEVRRRVISPKDDEREWSFTKFDDGKLKEIVISSKFMEQFIICAEQFEFEDESEASVDDVGSIAIQGGSSSDNLDEKILKRFPISVMDAYEFSSYKGRPPPDHFLSKVMNCAVDISPKDDEREWSFFDAVTKFEKRAEKQDGNGVRKNRKSFVSNGKLQEEITISSEYTEQTIVCLEAKDENVAPADDGVEGNMAFAGKKPKDIDVVTEGYPESEKNMAPDILDGVGSIAIQDCSISDKLDKKIEKPRLFSSPEAILSSTGIPTPDHLLYKVKEVRRVISPKENEREWSARN